AGGRRGGLAPGHLQLRHQPTKLALRRWCRHRRIGPLSLGILAVGDPFPARGAANCAHARSGGGVVQAAAIIHAQTRLAPEGFGDDLLHALGVELLELLIVESCGDRGDGAINLDICGHSTPGTPRPVRGRAAVRTGTTTCWSEMPGVASPLSMPTPRRLTPPFLRQLAGDPLGLGRAAQSAHSASLTARTRTADRVVQSICPYCAVGCGQKVYVKDEKVIQIEGDPASPISRGRLCPKGSASEKLVNSPMRETKVKYRRPGATEWEYLDLETATEMIAERMLKVREETWEEDDTEGEPLKRTLGIHFLGGATLDSEENYLIKKFFTAMGAVSIENQARI